MTQNSFQGLDERYGLHSEDPSGFAEPPRHRSSPHGDGLVFQVDPFERDASLEDLRDADKYPLGLCLAPTSPYDPGRTVWVSTRCHDKCTGCRVWGRLEVTQEVEAVINELLWGIVDLQVEGPGDDGSVLVYSLEFSVRDLVRGALLHGADSSDRILVGDQDE